MSIYTELSKQIGFEQEPVHIPAPEVAKELLHLVREKNEAAFKRVFIIYRFGPAPKNASDQEAINIICEAYNAGTIVFNNER